jgi:hypothetical protein
LAYVARWSACYGQGLLVALCPGALGGTLGCAVEALVPWDATPRHAQKALSRASSSHPQGALSLKEPYPGLRESTLPAAAWHEGVTAGGSLGVLPGGESRDGGRPALGDAESCKSFAEMPSHPSLSRRCRVIAYGCGDAAAQLCRSGAAHSSRAAIRVPRSELSESPGDLSSALRVIRVALQSESRAPHHPSRAAI